MDIGYINKYAPIDGKYASKKLSEEEIVKLAFAHEPSNLNSKKGRALAEQCLSRILPIYDASQRLSDVVKMNQLDDVKILIEKADIDTLLVCLKVSAFYISKDDDDLILSALQKSIIENLKSRDFNTLPQNNDVDSKKKTSISKPKESAVSVESNGISGVIKNIPADERKIWIVLIIVVILTVVVLAVAVTGFIVTGSIKNSAPGDKSPPENMTVEYYPKTELTDGQLKDASESISERVKALEINYDIKPEQGKVVLTIPDDFAETPEQKKYILEMLGADGVMGIRCGLSMKSEDCKEGFTSIDIANKSKKKFMSHFGDELADYSLTGKSTKEILKNLKFKDIYYLHVRLDKKTALKFSDIAAEADKLNNEIGKKLNEISGVFDFVKHNTLVNAGFEMNWTSAGVIIKGPDADEIFLIPVSDAAANPKCLEVLKKVLDSKSMISGFSYSIVEEPKWEKDEAQFGAYQQQDIKDKYIIALFDLGEYYNGELDDDKYKLAIQSIKDRLDLLKLPYAMGYSGLYGKNLSIKMSPEYLNSDMVRLLGNNAKIEFYSQYNAVYLHHEKFEIDNDSDGNVCLKVKFSESKEKVLSKFAGKIPAAQSDAGGKNIDNESVYLVVNDATIAGAKLTELQDDSTLCFSNLLLCEKDKISDEDVPFLELIQKIDQESDPGYKWTLASIKYYTDGKYVTDDISAIPWGYAGSNVSEQIKKTVESYNAKVTKSIQARNALEITIDVEEDQDFAANFMNKVEEIYKACNFDDCSNASIRFCEADAGKESTIDAAGFVFSKQTYGSMKMSGIVFDGPGYGKYAEEIERICRSDPFYKEKTKMLTNR